jgi:hypothetical protein
MTTERAAKLIDEMGNALFVLSGDLITLLSDEKTARHYQRVVKAWQALLRAKESPTMTSLTEQTEEKDAAKWFLEAPEQEARLVERLKLWLIPFANKPDGEMETLDLMRDCLAAILSASHRVREECAKVAELWGRRWGQEDNPARQAADHIAAAIRAGGEG